MHLYEAHLAVADTEASREFYTKVVGLPFAYRDPSRDIVFLWADSKEKGMLGLWGPNTAYGNQGVGRGSHVAFAVPLEKLFSAVDALKKSKIETLGFRGEKVNEPSVIGWMPSAQIYFRDLDGHMLELISILPDQPVPGFNGLYSEWKKLITK